MQRHLYKMTALQQMDSQGLKSLKVLKMNKALIPPKHQCESRAKPFCFASLLIHSVLPLKNEGAVHMTHLINTHPVASQVLTPITVVSLCFLQSSNQGKQPLQEHQL